MGSKNKLKRVLFIVFLITVLAIGIFFGVYLLRSRFNVLEFDDTINIEYKDTFKYKPGKVCFGNKISCKSIKAKPDGKVDSSSLGTYYIKYLYKYKDKKLELKQKVIVEDKKAPEIKYDKEDIIICPNGKILGNDIKAIDNVDGDVTSKITKKLQDKKVIIEVIDSNNNKTIKEYNAVVKDDEAPKINIKGDSKKTFYVGSSYIDEGIEVSDNCDDVDKIKIIADNNVNYGKAGSYEFTYTATDSSNNVSTAKRSINIIVPSDNSRDIYLTFDDGPSIYTEGLLDILAKYNVKATFFVTNNGNDSTILREYNEGHTVALHTSSHDYSYVYSSVNNYFDDLYSIQNRVKRITGEAPTLIRFPGGSSNEVSIRYDGGIKIMSVLTKEVENRGFQYYDWNISSGDAGGATTSNEVYNNVVSKLPGGYSIVLQHDTKKFSIDAVERIIQYGRANGYIFKPLTKDSPKSHHRVLN